MTYYATLQSGPGCPQSGCPDFPASLRPLIVLQHALHSLLAPAGYKPVKSKSTPDNCRSQKQEVELACRSAGWISLLIVCMRTRIVCSSRSVAVSAAACLFCSTSALRSRAAPDALKLASTSRCLALHPGLMRASRDRGQVTAITA